MSPEEARVIGRLVVIFFKRKKYNLLVLEKTFILLRGLQESRRNKARDGKTLSTAPCVSFCACPGLVITSGSSDPSRGKGLDWGPLSWRTGF